MKLQEIKEELSRFVDWYSENKKANTDLQSKINNVFDYIATKELENAKLKAEIESLNGEIRVLIGANQQLNSMFKIKDECAREYIEQIEKMKCCQNCEKYVGDSCKLVNCKYQYVEENREIYNEDKWELMEC